jgi:archaemetzincin
LSTLPENSIVISPIGDLDKELLEQLAQEISRVFGCQTANIPLLNDLDFALDNERRQYHSTPILEILAGKAPPRAVKVLGIAQVDLFIPILTYVYGEAQLGGKACIISTYRLKEGLTPLNRTVLYRQRVVKEALHELGHTFKLRHCRDQACIMHYCRSTRDVDLKSDQLCRYCTILLDDEIKSMGQKPGQ